MIKYRIKILILLFCILPLVTNAQDGFFSSILTREILDKEIVQPSGFRPIPKAGDALWQQVPEGVKNAYIREAEKNLNKPWESIAATEFMEFYISGNRMKYEFKLFDQRSRLEFAVIAELLENKGRFVDEIINGVWKICEETWWGAPAHYKTGMLPDKEEAMFIDLFFSETAQMLSWVHYLMKDQLDEKSPVVSKRLELEIQTRMLDDCLRQDFWWKSNKMNWGTWITSNWLISVMLIETDRNKQLDAIQQILKTMDGFYEEYPDDGGCDEGPSYWNRAAASLFESMDLLRMASDGRIDFSSDEKIRQMGAYYWKMYIAGLYFVNFADARPTIVPNVSIVYRFGEYIHDDRLVNLAGYVAHRENYDSGIFPNNDFVLYNDRPFLYGLGRQLFLLNLIDEIMAGNPAPPLVKNTWQSNLQIFTARQFDESTDGFYFAAKGGHNDESHNHNDVGTFSLYSYGQPLLIDLGVEQYTKYTFGNNRYDLWTMQSAYHNLPTINGIMQEAGREFSARNVKTRISDKEQSFFVDIAKAYSKEANVDFWNRTITLKSSGEFLVTEDFNLLKVTGDSTFISLMVYGDVYINTNGDITLTSDDGKRYRLTYDKKKLKPQKAYYVIKDPWLKASWKKGVTRIKLFLTGRNKKDKTTYILKEIL
ncbi:heparinase II/III family protein [uncultured Dysgonomonas sp.]|uniref:Heparinase II/III-like C-terminal domain-containing protein n=1 Tax=uncultured Dysgonomonas sp. TaxID=206096 RepID=A0A212K6U9_9BACT|nr:heparinase II/III family protein [uncultured Dysgonomonas sp.]SBW07443.1 conserved exported hypothetical protein [uncultured Dysgonomonas sp.]